MKIYTVAQDGKDRLKIFDVNNGQRVGTIHITEEIKGSPVVSGDQCSIQVETRSGVSQLRIYKLPSGSLIRTIHI